jgi:signal transduction histidine kinase
VFARATPTAFEQALDVLLENALRHGMGSTRISVRLRERHVSVRVADEGEHREGTGLGLDLARGLVEADGGRLRLADARPTTFEILLPRDGPRA